MKLDIRNGDCAEVLKQLDAGSIDLTVTSPPYDDLRRYKGYAFNFEATAQELFRVTKSGGVVVWVVGDATTKGSETGTAFKQALYFMSCGFNLHDTMIFHKEPPPCRADRYEQHFEYMFILSKGKPKTFNPIMVESKRAGWANGTSTFRKGGDDLVANTRKAPIAATKKKGNVWNYAIGRRGSTDALASKHPAIFPEALARDHILSWSNAGDTVLDPFLGSGTTGKIAIQESRRFIGIEISPEYCELAHQRIRAAVPQAANDGDKRQAGCA